jgi:DNA-binding IclR family transcriptional regulator
MPTATSNRTSRSLVYGLNLLKLFTAEQPVRGISELAELMNLSRPTAHRYASTYLELGYLEQVPLRRYRLARRSAGPGVTMLASLRIVRAACPILRGLRDTTGRTVSQAVLDGTDVVYLQRLCGFERGQYLLEQGLGAGLRRPARRTAAGKALMASLGETGRHGSRRIGPAEPVVDSGGLRSDARGIAITVQSEHHRRTAIEITVPTHAISEAGLTDQLSQPLLAADSALQDALAEDRGDDLCVAGLEC